MAVLNRHARNCEISSQDIIHFTEPCWLALETPKVIIQTGHSYTRLEFHLQETQLLGTVYSELCESFTSQLVQFHEPRSLPRPLDQVDSHLQNQISTRDSGQPCQLLAKPDPNPDHCGRSHICKIFLLTSHPRPGHSRVRIYRAGENRACDCKEHVLYRSIHTSIHAPRT